MLPAIILTYKVHQLAQIFVAFPEACSSHRASFTRHFQARAYPVR